MNLKCGLEPFYHLCSRADTSPMGLSPNFQGKTDLETRHFSKLFILGKDPKE